MTTTNSMLPPITVATVVFLNAKRFQAARDLPDQLVQLGIDDRFIAANKGHALWSARDRACQHGMNAFGRSVKQRTMRLPPKCTS